MPTRSQKAAVALAFAAAAVSLAAVATGLARDGSVDLTLLFGGLLMLALAIGGTKKGRRKKEKGRRSSLLNPKVASNQRPERSEGSLAMGVGPEEKEEGRRKKQNRF
jgi:hypothetical protein